MGVVARDSNRDFHRDSTKGGGGIGDTVGSRFKRRVIATGGSGSDTHGAGRRKCNCGADYGSAGRVAGGNSAGGGAVGNSSGSGFK